jgi:UDP-2-acetamido-2-deoxy-ribo-hexuluronate aminotransferase
MEFIDLKTQRELLQGRIEARMQAVVQHAQFIMGPEVAELEERLAEHTGARYCISCSSGTDALLIALMAFGVGNGDEVITTPFSFIATAEVIVLLGAKPVFVDIDPLSYNLDPRLLEAAFTPRTRAVIPVSLYGQCAEMNAINEVANRHGIAVIEDAAQSFGATYRGRQSCNLSTIGCTSFFPSKPLGCYGDGGACFTSDEGLATRMRQIRVHGQDRRYHHPLIGINGRLDTLQAAVLLAKLELFDDEIAARQRIGENYTSQLREVVSTPSVANWNTSVYAQYTIQVEDRKSFQEQLKAERIPTAVHYPAPLHLQPAFALAGFGAGSFPCAETAAERVISLPMHPYLQESDQQRVVDAVKRAVAPAAIISA